MVTDRQTTEVCSAELVLGSTPQNLGAGPRGFLVIARENQIC